MFTYFLNFAPIVRNSYGTHGLNSYDASGPFGGGPPRTGQGGPASHTTRRRPRGHKEYEI